MSSCSVELDNYQDEYHPRNTVEGRVICTFYKPKTIKEIRIELWAVEQTFWTVLEPYYDQSKMVTCTRSVEYTGSNKILTIEKSLTGEGELQPGRYEYPFTFDLPDDIPGTFSGENGSIKYFLRATVDRKFQINYENEIEFKVVAPIDLNIFRKEAEPVDYSAEGNIFSPFCCTSGPVVMDVHFPKTTFISGELISVNVEISNMSHESIQFVRLTVETEVEVMVTTPITNTKKFRQTILTGQESGVASNSERTYVFNLTIPKTTIVPNFNLCKLLKHKCWIDVIAMKPYVITLAVSTPIVIGQIAIHDKDEIQKMKSIQQSAHIALPPGGRPIVPFAGSSGPSAPPTEDNLPEMPPPSYETIYKD